jgi:hypothetical protein
MVVCFSGEPAAADDVFAPIRAIGDPAVDLLQPWPYTQQQSFLDESEPKGLHYYWKTEYLAELSDGALEAARDTFAECSLPDAQVGFLQLGGALNERDEGDGAVGNRDARYVAGVNAVWEPDDPNADAHRQWVQDGWARIRPYSTGRTYVNFQGVDEGLDRVRATYGANYERLLEIKERYDPDNLFRVNRNIKR